MPVLSDPSVFDAVEIESGEIHCLASALNGAELAGEMPPEVQSHTHPIASHDEVFHLGAEVWYRCAECL